jgi:hypothetical protein
MPDPDTPEAREWLACSNCGGDVRSCGCWPELQQTIAEAVDAEREATCSHLIARAQKLSEEFGPDAVRLVLKLVKELPAITRKPRKIGYSSSFLARQNAATQKGALDHMTRERLPSDSRLTTSARWWSSTSAASR